MQIGQGKRMAVDYDPVGRGNDIVVTTGETEVRQRFGTDKYEVGNIRRFGASHGDCLFNRG